MPLPPPEPGDALLVVDVQNDFVTGSLAVPGGADVVAPLNEAIRTFRRAGRPVVLTRDWHPADHLSFAARGGPWPPHCVAGTAGAAFVAGLDVPPDAIVVSKATHRDAEAYSTFAGTELDAALRARDVRRIVIGGLATDYCVVESVVDARGLGYDVTVLADAIRAVEAHPGDEARALARIRAAGARFADVGRVAR